MNLTVWDRDRVEYLDLGGPGYTYRYIDAPGICDLTYVHQVGGRTRAAQTDIRKSEIVRVTSTAGSPDSCAQDDNDPTKRFLRAVIQRLPPPAA